MNDIWKVKVLVLGHHTLDKSALVHDCSEGEILQIPITSLALENGEHKIVVDTGHHDAKWVSEHMLPAVTTPEEELETVLKNAMGWTLDEVDTVINTHLHFDHCGQNRLFKHAKFVVTKTEWEYAFKPEQYQRRLYRQELFDRTAVSYFDWQFIEDKDCELYPGLRLLFTPGHTPGHISILVRTAMGTVCFAGDVCPTVENLQKIILSNVVTSPEQMLHSYDRIRWSSDFIIPGHEPSIQQFQSENFPTCTEKVFY